VIQDEPGFIDLVEANNAQRMRVRIDHRRRMGRMHLAAGSAAARGEEGVGVHGSVRSLPSGPAPSWAGLALSVLLLTILGLALTVGLSGWLVVSLLIRIGKFVKGAGQ
jgi:hypothetical protein